MRKIDQDGDTPGESKLKNAPGGAMRFQPPIPGGGSGGSG